MGSAVPRQILNTEHAEGTETKGSTSVGEPAVEDGLVGVDAAVAEERPVTAGVFALGGIAFDDEDLFLVAGGFGNQLAERVRDKGVAPEFEAGVAVLGLAFKANAVDDGSVNAVGDGMRALN